MGMRHMCGRVYKRVFFWKSPKNAT